MIELNGGKPRNKYTDLVVDLLKKNKGFGLRMSEIMEQTGLKRVRYEEAIKDIKYITYKGVRYYFIDKENK